MRMMSCYLPLHILFSLIVTSQLQSWHTWVHAQENITTLRRSSFPSHPPPQSRLNISHRGIIEIQDGAFVGFPALSELLLSGNRLRSVSDRTWRGLRRLKLLDLTQNLLVELPQNAFDGLFSLQELHLQDNQLTAIPQAVRGLSGLRFLSLAENKISHVYAGALQGCQDLAELHLEHNLISHVSDGAFLHLDNLQMLDLSSNNLDIIHAPAIRHLWERGATLHLHDNPWKCECDLALKEGHVEHMEKCLGNQSHNCRLPWRVSPVIHSHITAGQAPRLPCGSGGEMDFWQTPFGRLDNSNAPVLDSLALLNDSSLQLHHPGPQHTGLYYCLQQDTKWRTLFPYRVQFITGSVRKSRNVPGSRTTVSQSHFSAAVASSVLITFLVGFILGAFSRTYLSRCLQSFQQRKKAEEFPRVAVDGVSIHDFTTIRWRDLEPENNPTDVTLPTKDDEPPQQRSPPRKAPRLSVYGQGADNLVGGGDKLSHLKRSQPVDDDVVDSGNKEFDGEVDHDAITTLEEGGASSNGGTSKRRVIKLYNYDEEGNHYAHIKDSREQESLPSPRQRSLSLTRLNAIVFAATTTPSSQDTSKDERNTSESMPTFELSI